MVDLTATPDASDARPIINAAATKTHVFDANMQKKFLLEYDLIYKIKSQEWTKLTVNKKALMTIICGQCNNVTVTKLALGSSYADDCNNENIINFLTD